MNTYIVRVHYTHETETKPLRVSADSPIEAVLQAGAYAGRESEGNVDTLELLSVHKVNEVLKEEWSV